MVVQRARTRGPAPVGGEKNRSAEAVRPRIDPSGTEAVDQLLVPIDVGHPLPVLDVEVRCLGGVDLRINQPVLLGTPHVGRMLTDKLDPALDRLKPPLPVPFVLRGECVTFV